MTISSPATAQGTWRATSAAGASWNLDPPKLGFRAYLTCFNGIVWREVLRYLHQRERFFSALVRPLVWLLIFAAGFRQTLGVSIIPPYETYVLYEVFITPGLIGMIQLFNAMQSSLSMVYDRETGAMRTLLVSPFPRSFLLLSKLVGGVAVSLLQVYAYLFIAYFWEIEPPIYGYFTVLPALVLSGLMLGSMALFLSSVIKQLENFAGVMNFVIFPMFFASSALYPLWRVKEFERPPLRDLSLQSLHPGRGAHSLCSLRTGGLDLACCVRGLHLGVPGRGRLRLQPVKRPDRSARRSGRRSVRKCPR